MLLPLVLGFLLARATRVWKDLLLVLARRLSNLTFVLLVILMIGVNLRTLVSTFGSFAIGTYTLFVLAMATVGYLIGAADRATQAVFALGAGNRNIAAALVVAQASFSDPAITVMLLVASVVGLIILIGLAKLARQMAAKSPTVGDQSQ